MHHLATSREGWDANSETYATGCIKAALQAVRIAEALSIRGLLHEAYPLTIDVLVMAAISLLVAQLGASPLTDDGTHTIEDASRTARALLAGLALKNSTAAQCWESLQVGAVVWSLI